MKTKKWAILLVAFTTFLNAAAQILFKLGVEKFSEFSLFSLLTNYFLILGFALYGISAVLLIYALRHGELSILYPVVALTFIWVSLLSHQYIDGDFMNLEKWGGVFLIFLGVSSIGVGSRWN